MADISNFTQDGAPLFAAFAAAASWAAVFTNQRLAREALRPRLLLSPTQVYDTNARGKASTTLVILNAGHAAESVEFVLSAGGEYSCNPAGRGLLRRDELAHVSAMMLHDRDPRALAICRDINQQVWAFGSSKRPKRYNKLADPASVWKDFYGESLDDLVSTGCNVELKPF